MSQEQVDINSIINGCKRQDPKSQKELVMNFAPYLLSTAKRFCNDNVSPKDILQESYILIFKNFHQYDSSISSLKTWMNRIVINTALKYLRQRHIKYELPTESIEDEQIEVPEIFSNLQFDEIIKLVQKLPIGYREVFNLYVFDDYSHEEIAKALSITPSTSRSQLARARKLLKEQVQSLINELERI
jgi:RNA polymerase sigma-70 factor (ECF subfamily)